MSYNSFKKEAKKTQISKLYDDIRTEVRERKWLNRIHFLSRESYTFKRQIDKEVTLGKTRAMQLAATRGTILYSNQIVGKR